MNKIFRFSISTILIALLVGTLGLADNTQAAWFSQQVDSRAVEVRSGKALIDPNIYISLEREGTARVLVILKQQADLSGASRLQTKAEKGAYVYRQLTSIAVQTQAPLRAFLEAREANYKAYWIQNMFMVTVDTRLLDELANQPGIARIENYSPPIVESFGQNLGPDYEMEFGPPLPAMASNQAGDNLEGVDTEVELTSPATVGWNLQRVGAVDVWAMGFTGQGVVVGSLDTGVEYTHPALVNQYRGNLGGGNFDHNYNWFDGVGGSPFPVDYGFHGTYAMGPTLGDDGDQNQIGVAPGAEWIACPGSGGPFVNQLDCYQWFLAPTDLNGNNPRPDLAPDMINHMLNSPADYHSAIQALYAAGIYIIQPAFNSGPQCRTLILPVNQLPEVTTTAAFDETDNITDFSSRGPAQVGHETLVKPDIAAPGVNVHTSVPGGLYLDAGWGTSVAAPHVSGAAALLISAVPELRGRVDVIEMLLKTNAEPKPTTECTPGGGVPNNVWGWGILNVHDAVLAAQQLEWGAIGGLVVEAGTLNPMADVRLTFTDTTLDWPYHETSADLGDYGHILPAGSYDITAIRYGYLDSLINGVVISAGITTTQEIEMSPAHIWTVSGVVSDSLTGEPLPASIVLEGTPVSTETDPETGGYSAQAAQGEWWLVVTSPGYAEEAIQITLDQDLVLNFSLDPVINYYMRRSVDGECGAQFDWLDATGGTPWPITWLDFQYVSLPAGRTFSFYGNTYPGIYINAYGIVTFGSGYADFGGPIPNPNLPNNAIDAFSTFLNPGTDWEGGGFIYTKYVDNRFFVIEWYQVVHWVNHNPETFEIILDLDTNVIKLQYLTVNNPTGVVVGVENSTGTVATQYAYGDPASIANNTAVEFYPVFGAPPPSGGAGMLTGAVTDAHTSLPIEGAVVTAVAFTPPRETSTYTTDISGTYSASLCADWYDVMAGAVGYTPGEGVRVSVYPDEQTIQDFTLTAYISPTAVSITGPVEGWAAIPYTFTAAVEPITTTLPLTYTWQLGGQIPITHTGGLSDTNDFIWDMPGTQLITVTASNLYGSVSDTHPITITDVPIEGLAASNDSPTLFGEATTFTAVITRGTNVLFAWDFGDGFRGDGAVITHTYSSSGLFTATVTATNTTNSTSDTTQVTIIAPNYPTYLPLVIKTSETPLAPSSALPEGGMLMGLVILSIIGRWRRRG